MTVEKILRLSLIGEVVGLSSSIRLEVMKKQTQVIGIGHQRWMKKKTLRVQILADHQKGKKSGIRLNDSAP